LDWLFHLTKVKNDDVFIRDDKKMGKLAERFERFLANNRPYIISGYTRNAAGSPTTRIINCFNPAPRS
jgi:hypothetical protein